jgi:integrase
LGHTSTEMLFRVYSRYVPNLTRQDGSAMERLLASQMAQGPLIEQKQPGGNSTIYVPAKDAMPQPLPKLRGMHHPSYVRKAGEVSDRPNTYLDQGGASSNEDAQPPPRHAWMQMHPPMQLS